MFDWFWWIAVLGNHDYRGDVLAQMSHVLRKVDPRWLCLRSFIVNSELTELFFVDTTPFVKMYFQDKEGHTYDWRGIASQKSYIAALLKVLNSLKLNKQTSTVFQFNVSVNMIVLFLQDLEQGLRESRAKWKIVIGHHAIRSIGHHGDTQELIHHILPLLKVHYILHIWQIWYWNWILSHLILWNLQMYEVDYYMNGHDHCLEHISDKER